MEDVRPLVEAGCEVRLLCCAFGVACTCSLCGI